MCGICGYWGPGDTPLLVEAMTETLRHRGPDAGAVWTEREFGLGHRRLAIIDLSPAGLQPMISASGRYVMVFNGEIYNYRDLRQQLEPYSWKGTSDTEVLLAGWEAWGAEETLRRAQGMLALAVWDRQREVLVLARDRMGKKPLYWARVGRAWAFGSELKAFRSLPGWTGELDPRAWPHYFRNGFIPAPLSAYRGVSKLPAGTWLELKKGENASEPRPFWSLEPSKITRFAGTYDDAVDQLETLLDDAVACRMVSDVPLGAFLSGGIDSTLVVSSMVRQSSSRVKTYTIGFEEDEYDESPYARALAAELGTEHHEHRVRASDALSLIPQLTQWFDEPFADSSQIPAYWVAHWARQDVTVALSGDGGDESFGGYTRYGELDQALRRWGRKPRSLLWPVGVATSLLGNLNPAWKNRGRLVRSLSGRARDEAIYRYQMAHFKQATDILAHPQNAPVAREHVAWSDNQRNSVERAMLDDSLVYLPDDVLTKVDRTSMAVSLEARAPLLDYRVVEFAWSLPLEFKWTANGGKRVLRSVLEKRVPKALLDRPKKGFSLPIGPWLKGPLRPWAEELLSVGSLEQSGQLRTSSVRRLWVSFLAGQHDWSAYLWDVLVYQSWFRTQKGVS